MPGCNANLQNTLDIYQSIIDGINKSVTTLENQADIIKPWIDLFDTTADSITSPLANNLFLTELNKLTAETICATSTDLELINDFTADCLNEGAAAIKRYLRNILSNIEDATGILLDALTQPERLLLTYYQRIRVLADSIKDLITGLNNKIECITSAPNAGDYSDQIDDINDDIQDVIDDLRLLDDGSFDIDEFLDGWSGTNPNIDDVKDNVKSYSSHADDLEQEINDNVSNTVDLSATVNPPNRF